MRIWYSKLGETNTSVYEPQSGRVAIGRGPANDIVLNSPFVAENAAVLVKSGLQWELIPLGENAIVVGRQPLHHGERALVRGAEPIQIYPYTVSLDLPLDESFSEERFRRQLDDQISELILRLHRELLARMDVPERGDAHGERGENEEYLIAMENDLAELARLAGFVHAKASSLVNHCAAKTVQGELMSEIVEQANQVGQLWNSRGKWTRFYSAVPDFERDLAHILQNFRAKAGLASIQDLSQQIEQVESCFWPIWNKMAANLHVDLKQYLGLRHIKKQIKDIVFGYGPLEDLLRMPNISEIMVVDREKIYVEKNGVLEQSGRRFVSDDVTVAIIDRIVSRVGRRIDKSQPLVDARLMDGSRVNAVIPPLSISGPCLTIRKFPLKRLEISDLVEKGSLNTTAAEFLRAAVVARKNILVSGGTGSGKTTLLNCLSNFIPDKERIVTIEDTAELQLQKKHVVRMETKLANVEGTGEYTIRDLVRNSLRMRPDRIVVGECRGPEALDMLQAMNTGHDGSMTTIHANNATDVILRLEVLVQMAADLPVHSIHRQIASAIDLIVQLSRTHDGRRVVSQITEVVAFDLDQGEIRTKDLFVLDPDSSQLVPTGALPTFMGQLIESNIINLDTFYV